MNFLKPVRTTTKWACSTFLEHQIILCQKHEGSGSVSVTFLIVHMMCLIDVWPGEDHNA